VCVSARFHWLGRTSEIDRVDGSLCWQWHEHVGAQPVFQTNWTGKLGTLCRERFVENEGLSLGWKSEGVTDDESSESIEEVPVIGIIIIIIIVIIMITSTVFMVLSASHCESSPVHLMNVDWAPSGRQPSDQPSRLGLWVGIDVKMLEKKLKTWNMFSTFDSTL